MYIGITGAKGFIGQNLIEYFKKQGIHYIEISCLELESYASKGITHIIHLAGKTSVFESWSTIPDTLESNVVLASRVFDFARKISASVTLCSTYGYYPCEHHIQQSPYHLTKCLVEQLASFYHQHFGLPIHILRLASVYGIHQRRDCLIPTIFTQILEPNTNEIVVNNLSPMRSYIDVRDVVECLYISSIKNSGLHKNFVGSKELVSVKDVICIALQVSGSHKPCRELYIGEDKDLLSHNIQKNMLLENTLQWHPKYSLQQGLAYFCEHYKAL